MRLRQEDHEFKASLGYIVSPVSNNPPKICSPDFIVVLFTLFSVAKL
jgi:hypothetical protein